MLLTNLAKIEEFLKEHHLLTLATSSDNLPQVANLFFTYDKKEVVFLVASDFKTEHIKNVLKNPNVAGSVALETSNVGKIQGIQFKAIMSEGDSKDKEYYLRVFPFSRVMNPIIWKISLQEIKFTDNHLGFGKKLLWKKAKKG